MAKRQKETVEGQALDDLVNQCLVVTDIKGEILGEDSTSVTSYLAMEYQSDYGKITFEVNVSAMGNGSYNLIVKEGKKILFKAHGSYTAGPYNSCAGKYVSGDWKKKLQKEYDQIMR